MKLSGAMINLEEKTIVGNPLYFPVRNSDESYRLEFRQARAGLWVAAPPPDSSFLFDISVAYRAGFNAHAGKLPESLEGALFLQKSYGPKIRFFSYLTLYIELNHYRPVSLERLLQMECLEQASYGQLFSSEDYAGIQDEIGKIPPIHQTVYQVTKKGHELVCIGKSRGKARRSRQEDQIATIEGARA
jgi:hypothetical protein